jgi:SAM-dependent methyltransferase
MAHVSRTWDDREKVDEYVARVGRLPARLAGEAELVAVLPDTVRSVLDLGCGDGRVAACVLDAHPEVERVIGLDRSPPMLDAARAQFASDARVVIDTHDLADPLPGLGTFDAVVSGFAIHHVVDRRKQELFREIRDALSPGGVFANLEVVQCATEDLQAEFYRRIGRPGGDPEDRLAAVEPQLEWMRAAGLRDVDCHWRWRGFALLAGRR